MDKTNEKFLVLDNELVEATKAGRMERVKELIGKGASKDVRDAFGNTLLIMAAQAGNLDMVEYLAGIGIDINATNMCKLSATKVAETNGYPRITEFLKDFKKNQAILFAYNDNIGIGDFSSSSPNLNEIEQKITPNKKSKSTMLKCFG